MDENNTLIAIDLGSTHITAIAAQYQDENTLKILGDETMPVKDIQYGIVTKTTNAAMNINKCLKLLQNRIRLKNDIESVFVSVGGRSMQMVETTAKRYLGTQPFVSAQVLEDMRKEAESKCTNENHTVFSVTPHHFILDQTTQVLLPLNQKATNIEGHYGILIGNPLIVNNLQKCFDRTGILIESSSTKPEAIATALLSAEEREAGCAIIDFGGETTTLSIFKDGNLQHVTVVPLGSQHITNDIEVTFGISEKYAEKLKRSKGQAVESLVQPVYIVIPSNNQQEAPVRVSTKQLACIIEARLEEMTAKIFSQLKVWEPELEGNLYLTGGGCMLDNIIDFVQKYTTMPVEYGSHMEWLSNDTPEEYYKPYYSQLIGTLILGDTYRKEHLEKQKKKPKIPKVGNFMERMGEHVLRFFEDDN